MSYYKVKAISIDREKEQIWVTAAVNNVRPLQFLRREYGENVNSLTEKLNNLFVDILDGNLQLYPSCKWFGLVSYLMGQYDSLVQNTDMLLMDHIYRTQYDRKLKTYLAKTYGTPSILGQEANPDYSYEKSFLAVCKNAWNREQKRLGEQGILFICSASILPWLPEYDVLYTRDGKIVVGKGSSYDNCGRFDNSKKEAIQLETKYPDKIWNLFAYDIPKHCKTKDLEKLEEKYPEAKPVFALWYEKNMKKAQ